MMVGHLRDELKCDDFFGNSPVVFRLVKAGNESGQSSSGGGSPIASGAWSRLLSFKKGAASSSLFLWHRIVTGRVLLGLFEKPGALMKFVGETELMPYSGRLDPPCIIRRNEESRTSPNKEYYVSSELVDAPFSTMKQVSHISSRLALTPRQLIQNFQDPENEDTHKTLMRQRQLIIQAWARLAQDQDSTKDHESLNDLLFSAMEEVVENEEPDESSSSSFRPWRPPLEIHRDGDRLMICVTIYICEEGADASTLDLVLDPVTRAVEQATRNNSAATVSRSKLTLWLQRVDAKALAQYVLELSESLVGSVETAFETSDPLFE